MEHAAYIVWVALVGPRGWSVLMSQGTLFCWMCVWLFYAADGIGFTSGAGRAGTGCPAAESGDSTKVPSFGQRCYAALNGVVSRPRRELPDIFRFCLTGQLSIATEERKILNDWSK